MARTTDTMVKLYDFLKFGLRLAEPSLAIRCLRRRDTRNQVLRRTSRRDSLRVGWVQR